ncbi:unnamed protein product [Rotaria socialis]|uniref:Activator of Hsp90 ATPase AHSA1-like N-terminal domain-containing protein n=2 Tax=Rotaria TaxID=231623 RepID=A0A820LEI1_9BILA|nr:unnamed protein product [Rotaria socialis]CAF4354831.1 unnamed protein product [Rotaria socialis]
MAEWGKGDPRWIVEDRPDATNPNNWHWKEKNATQWSKDKFKELLIGLKIENEEYTCEIKELKKCSGESSVNNRKAKLFFLYEWYIQGKWEGSSRTGENPTKYEGSFDIPNLSDENEIHEVNITFSVDKSKGEKLIDLMKSHGESIIRQKLAEYIRLLKEQFSQGLILPTIDNTNTTDTKSVSSINNSKTVINPQILITENKSPTVTFRDLKIHDKFNCTKIELFTTFCDINKVKAFTQNSVSQYDCRKGGFFSLFSDNITGRFLDIVPYDRIDILWRFKSWPSDHYSHVSLSFHDDTDQTKIFIQQTGVPSQFYDNTMQGWKHFYFESIKSTFGYGSRLL